VSPLLGVAYVASLLILTLVVASVYSAAQDAHDSVRHIARQTLRRSFKLIAVLAALALTVHFLSRI
jgi:type III secretory pathway component EscS